MNEPNTPPDEELQQLLAKKLREEVERMSESALMPEFRGHTAAAPSAGSSLTLPLIEKLVEQFNELFPPEKMLGAIMILDDERTEEHVLKLEPGLTPLQLARAFDGDLHLTRRVASWYFVSGAMPPTFRPRFRGFVLIMSEAHLKETMKYFTTTAFLPPIIDLNKDEAWHG